MNLSDLQQKEVIDIATGKRIGLIIDVIIAKNGVIDKLILENSRGGRRFFREDRDDVDIYWKQIVKIGDDIILVDGTN